MDVHILFFLRVHSQVPVHMRDMMTNQVELFKFQMEMSKYAEQKNV